MPENTTDTDAPPKAFHLELDTVPPCVRDEVMAAIKKIECAILSAPTVAAVTRYAAEAGIATAHIGPRECNLIGAWASLWIKDSTELVALRRALAKDGWRYLDKSDYPDERRFVILLVRGDRESIGLNVYLGGDGARCQYIEVGKKEVPVYELKCEGAEVAP